MTPNAEDWAAAVEGYKKHSTPAHYWITRRAHELARLRAASEPPAGDAVIDRALDAGVNSCLTVSEAIATGVPENDPFQRDIVRAIIAAAPSPAVRASPPPPDFDSVTLSAGELLCALDFIAPDRDADQLETDCVIQYKADGHDGAGYYAWYSEYPEEGAIKLTASAIEQDAAAREPRT